MFHVGRKPQVEKISNCDCLILVDTLEKDEEFEPLNAQIFRLFFPLMIAYITMPVTL